MNLPTVHDLFPWKINDDHKFKQRIYSIVVWQSAVKKVYMQCWYAKKIKFDWPPAIKDLCDVDEVREDHRRSLGRNLR